MIMDQVNNKTSKQMVLDIANKFVTKSIFDMDDDELKLERIQAKENAIKCVYIILNNIPRSSSPERNYWLSVRNELLKLLKN
jgi:hypothetical protein